MQNQKKPIQQKKPMQNFTAEKWADKIALFIDNFGFLSGFFWHWTIALPSPTSHLAMLHSKIILSDPNRRVKVVCIGFSLFWSWCRTWGRFLEILNVHFENFARIFTKQAKDKILVQAAGSDYKGADHLQALIQTGIHLNARLYFCSSFLHTCFVCPTESSLLANCFSKLLRLGPWV